MIIKVGGGLQPLGPIGVYAYAYSQNCSLSNKKSIFVFDQAKALNLLSDTDILTQHGMMVMAYSYT